ncbi:MAG TPA: hypothetical protein VMH05_05590 [Bryobacteraceae bacterium]|nr:hypothetical protein [Bryobacteraceae bacterium]
MLLLDASFDGQSAGLNYFALHRAYERPGYVEFAPPTDPAMTLADPPAPGWCLKVQSRLAWILGLPDNWDGYGAKRVEHETVRRAWSFLRAVMPPDALTPDIGPTKDGQLQFDWHRDSADLEIRMRGGGEFEIAFDDVGEPDQSWEDVTTDSQRAIDAIREISKRP